MPDTSDARALATRLAGLSDAVLADALAVRGIAPSVNWHDYFDAADGLLDAASIDRSLHRLPRSVLTALHAGVPIPAEPGATLSRLLLADVDGLPYQAVSARVTEAAAAHPEAFIPAPTAATPEPSDEAQCAASAEHVFAIVATLADLLLASLHAPLGRTGAGTVSAADRRRLVEAGVLDAGDDLDDLIAAAVAAGLAHSAEREWVADAEAETWLRESTTSRWRLVAEGLRDGLPPDLRTPDGGYVPLPAWADAFPLDPDWPTRTAQALRIAEQWTLVLPDGTEPPWARSIREGGEADTSTLAAYLPAEIDRVYLQADLTAIAPGPLSPPLDLRLRAIAHRESRAQASTYRFSADSLRSGIIDGESAESIRSFLSELSLTGIPQPLDYLIESTANRHGRVTVGTDAATGRTRVDTDDPQLRDTLAIDQALRPLGLVPDQDRLTTRAHRDAVYWALVDARYPVIAVDDDGAPLPLRRRRASAGDGSAAANPYDRLIATLRSGAGQDDDADAAWLVRELEQAVRARAVIAVAVKLPDGSARTFTIEASGLGGGRLRGRDRGADVERTLPVSSIVSVQPVA
ncbi:helicase-associated domain-containing protein [Microbacterium sp. P02]|uniref:helicase-associated domain-containing protein n=1 Tax=Microbacterium sp. P02 TaxID=3366260 RepID=UPI00366D1F10